MNNVFSKKMRTPNFGRTYVWATDRKDFVINVHLGLEFYLFLVRVKKTFHCLISDMVPTFDTSVLRVVSKYLGSKT